ncbi:MAG: NTP transferase domain-containing protein [Deltaproteobacteria bacterium]|nr:NTP transferase domain-containing protein [Deltaproteobacteria bacterium]
MKEIDAVILCGGLGSRLKKVVHDRPKPMAEIQGRPFLDILIDHTAAFGITRYILCTGYMANCIEHYYAQTTGPLTFSFSKEKIPLGTGGALKNAESLIRSNPVLVLNGDSFCPVDLDGFITHHRAKNAQISLVVSEAKDSFDFGSLWMDKKGRIVGFQEKINHTQNLINAGVYLFDKEIFARIPPHKRYSLELDLFPDFVGKKFYGFFSNEKVLDIGTPERYELAKKLLVRK